MGKSFSRLIAPGKVVIVLLSNPEGFGRGKNIILAAFSCPYALRRILGPIESSPLSPAISKTVRFASFCLVICGFYERK
jgi:hypothetical protein